MKLLENGYAEITAEIQIAHQSHADILLLNKANKTVDFIDVAVSLGRSITKICPDKTNKYATLAEELMQV